jgi:hypothetical protein
VIREKLLQLSGKLWISPQKLSLIQRRSTFHRFQVFGNGHINLPTAWSTVAVGWRRMGAECRELSNLAINPVPD